MKIMNPKRALLISVLSIFLCCAMLVGTTYAWFTDEAMSRGNRIKAGKFEVDLLMDKAEDGNYSSIAEVDGEPDIFCEEQGNHIDWEPGKTEIVYLAVKNTGSLALKYTISLAVEGELVDALEYAIIDDVKAGDLASKNLNAWSDIEALTSGVTMGNIEEGETDVIIDNNLLAEDADEGTEDHIYYFAFAVHMKEEAGNDYQDIEANIDVLVSAAQYSYETDAFGNSNYDKDASYATDAP